MGSSALAGMRDSIRLRSRHRRAGDEQHPTGVLHLDRFESLTTVKIADTRMGICYFWQRMRDSNPRKRSQSPVCYRYTNPLCHTEREYYSTKTQNVKDYFYSITDCGFLPGKGTVTGYPE